MKRFLPPLLALLAAAGCATTRPYSPVHQVAYSAIGEQPFWMLNIGDDRIVLRLTGQAPGGSRYAESVFPRTLPRTENGVRIWQSGEGEGAIVIEARPGPCANGRGQAYTDQVVVRLGGREMTGCGGPLLGPAPR